MTDKPVKKAAAAKKPVAKKAAAKSAAPTAPAAPAARTVDNEELDRLAGGAHHDPHSILGAHPFDGHVTVRALRPGAHAVTIEVGDERVPMTHERSGVWIALLDRSDVPDYRLLVDYGDGFEHRQDDPYRYLPT